jgi:lysophospholipase L1-like esterase
MSYVSPAGSGDQTSDEEGSAYTRTEPSWFWLAGVDTESSWPGTIVALGDSITDGYLLLPDQQETWPAVLATRLSNAPPAQRHAVVNAGISGNELTGSLWPEYGASAVSRVNADGLDLAGVTSLIVFEGTNDLSHGVTASQVVVALDRIAVQARRRGVRVFGATITPRSDLSWNQTTMEPAREAVNQWIRTSGDFDGVLDFDRVLRDPRKPHQLAPAYQTDGLHPNPLGLRVVAQSIDLSLFA